MTTAAFFLIPFAFGAGRIVDRRKQAVALRSNLESSG